MRRLTLLTALSLGALLLAGPAAEACGELVETTSECSMTQPMDGLACSDSGHVSPVCCVARPAPDPVASLSFDRAVHQVTLEPLGRLAESPSLALQIPVATPAGCQAACDLGRYTLFLSLLL